MTYEIELKIKLQGDDKRRIEDFLSSNQFTGKYLGGFEQTDYYFDTLEPSFARKDIALRVRVENSLDNSVKTKPTIELTYKGKKLNPDSKTRLEYNLELLPGSNLQHVESFFNELGFINSVSIYKKRLNYSLESDIVLSLDTNELGDFVEIEKILEEKDLIESTENYLWDYLETIVGKMSKNRKIVKSYLELILEANNNKNK